jgi:chromosome segregation ATPase
MSDAEGKAAWKECRGAGVGCVTASETDTGTAIRDCAKSCSGPLGKEEGNEEAMTNYEFRIKVLEAELAHVREMYAIHRAALEDHDTGLEYTGNRMAALEAALETLTANMNTLTTNVNTLAGKVDALVSALLREHPNGSKQS